MTLIISHVFSSLILSYYTLNRITVASKVLNLLTRCSFLQSPAVMCGHIGDFDAFSMFAAEDSLCDLRSLSGLNPGPPSPRLPLSKIQNLGCENHLDVRGTRDWTDRKMALNNTTTLITPRGKYLSVESKKKSNPNVLKVSRTIRESSRADTFTLELGQKLPKRPSFLTF